MGVNTGACCLLTSLEGLVSPLNVSESRFFHVLNRKVTETSSPWPNLMDVYDSPDKLGKPELTWVLGKPNPTQPNPNTYWLSIPMISLWVKNEAQKLIPDYENRDITWFISKAWLEPGVWKGKITSVSGCHADKLETFEWGANRRMSHLESTSYQEDLMASRLQ